MRCRENQESCLHGLSSDIYVKVIQEDPSVSHSSPNRKHGIASLHLGTKCLRIFAQQCSGSLPSTSRQPSETNVATSEQFYFWWSSHKFFNQTKTPTKSCGSKNGQLAIEISSVSGSRIGIWQYVIGTGQASPCLRSRLWVRASCSRLPQHKAFKVYSLQLSRKGHTVTCFI